DAVDGIAANLGLNGGVDADLDRIGLLRRSAVARTGGERQQRNKHQRKPELPHVYLPCPCQPLFKLRLSEARGGPRLWAAGAHVDKSIVRSLKPSRDWATNGRHHSNAKGEADIAVHLSSEVRIAPAHFGQGLPTSLAVFRLQREFSQGRGRVRY